ncbi:transcription repressor NadR [Erysipelothrix sp. HDW6B]|uniref:transcription repressor NadR n=1 Tax=Erysipelothrix sp. HDW6B TaxID=2714929 RepID=UPI001408C173|nr:transcription repressor NadR [Erysipelothrix sp. HDW6B]QIK87047.1 transcription repressor NadR [Erysipelothrix sp. HDW6B]
MTGEKRRISIVELLMREQKSPLSAQYIASIFKVSRQIIVGDIALLRAQGVKIQATPRGYIINQTDKRPHYIIPVAHHNEDTRRELSLLVDNDVSVIDVTVEHPIYGEITGQLNINTHEDIEAFINKNGTLLSSLTDGIHIHTIACNDDAHYQCILKLLRKHNLLYESN